jgi:hypothetical protein
MENKGKIFSVLFSRKVPFSTPETARVGVSLLRYII